MNGSETFGEGDWKVAPTSRLESLLYVVAQGVSAIFFAFSSTVSQAPAMTKPLALIFYENLLPGSQLVSRLEDLGYRVQPISDARMILNQAERNSPIVVLMDLNTQKPEVYSAIQQLKETTATRHIPIVGFARQGSDDVQEKAQSLGVAFVAHDTAIVPHLPQFLDQALEVR